MGCFFYFLPDRLVELRGRWFPFGHENDIGSIMIETGSGILNSSTDGQGHGQLIVLSQKYI